MSSVRIAQAFKDQAKCEIEAPQINRDPNKPFHRALVKINTDTARFNEISKAMKYFEIDNKPCRALPFDKDLLGTNRNQTNKNTIFVKGLDENIKSKELEEKFSKFGQVKSAKVSINADYTSRRYGYVCFTNQPDAQILIQ